MKISSALRGLAIGSAAMLLPADAGASGTGLAVGDRFPELVLPSLSDGSPTSISSFRGRKIVLHVWASW